jgi:signal transduction histidine kinase
MNQSKETVLATAAVLAIAASAAALAGPTGWGGLWFGRFVCLVLAMLLAQVPWIWSCQRARTALADRSKQLCTAEQVLRASQWQNAEFIAAASHEMKTPLAGIKAYVELLADGDADDDTTREEFLQIINGQADRLQRLIDDLLNGRLMVENELGRGTTFRATSVGSGIV